MYILYTVLTIYFLLLRTVNNVNINVHRVNIVKLYEQVRVLRGLGAIQPGVNRCKLIADSDFDLLYKDCTTSR